jgi:hypothetical protein
MRSLFISGEPVLWSAGASQQSAEREEHWKSRIRSELGDALPTPTTVLMHFAVQSWTRRGNRFDLDNLTTPVFEAIYGKKETNRQDARAALTSWRATIAQSTTPYLLLDFVDERLSTTDIECDCRVVLDAVWTPPLPANSGSGDGGLPAWVKENIGNYVPTENDRFGVYLAFGSNTRHISRPEAMPIKPVIDCLYPIFGGLPKYGHDWKKYFLQVERRDDLDGTCRICCWVLNGQTIAP